MSILRGSVGRTLTAVAVCLSRGSIPAFSQNTFGSIVGTVTDTSGAAVSGATVTITNDATGEHRTAPTSSSGDYQFLSLLPGNYKLDIEGAGFKHYSRDPIIVQVDQSPRANATMEVGQVSQQVVVTSQAPIMQTETASLGQVVSGKTVTNIPLNGRNVLALVSLVPGVVPQGSFLGEPDGTERIRRRKLSNRRRQWEPEFGPGRRFPGEHVLRKHGRACSRSGCDPGI